MKTLLYLFLIFLFIPSILLFLNNLMTPNFYQNRKSSSPFECGFNPMSPSRCPFSLHFFMIALIFLIFDIEIALILPIPIALNTINPSSLLITSTLFLIIIIFGLLLEWKNGALDWIK